MPTGNSATLFWGLVTLAATFGVGGYQLTGAKSRNLWVLCGLFVLLAFLLGFGLVGETAAWMAAIMRAMWVAYPLITVLVVAMLVKDKRDGPAVESRDADAPILPKFASAPSTRWKPDINLREAIHYLGARSTWRYGYGPNDVKNATEELTSALAANKITAWGREHPGEGEFYQIRQHFWSSTEATLQKDFVFSNCDQIGAHDIRLCQKQMEQVWPPKDAG